MWLNPPVLFFGVWFLNFFVYQFDFVFQFYKVTLSPKTEWLFVVSFIVFFLGSTVVALFRNTKPVSVLAIEPSEYSYLLLLKKLTIVYFVLVVLGLVGKYTILIAHYGNPFSHLEQIRELIVSGQLVYPPILQVFSVFRYVLVLNLAVLVVFSQKKKVMIWFLVVSVIASFFTDLAVAGRGGFLNVFLFLVGGLIAASFAKGFRLHLKHYAALAGSVVVLVGIFGGVLYVRHHQKNFLPRFAGSAYLYFTGTIPAVESFVSKPFESKIPGYFTFSAPYQFADAALRLIGKGFLSPDEQKSYYAPITDKGPFNSAGHLAYYYSDFREIGIIVIPFLMAFIASWLFFSVSERPRILTIQLWAIGISFLLFTIRGTLTSGTSIWLAILIILLQRVLFHFENQVSLARRRRLEHTPHVS
jgi:oligosaccharide repeat unit polymerase